MPWVLGVTRNVCFEQLRRRYRQQTDAHPDPASGLVAADQRGFVETTQLLDGLPMDQREALILTQIIGLPYADAAEVVGCPIGTIRSRVARGRSALAEALYPGEKNAGEL